MYSHSIWKVMFLLSAVVIAYHQLRERSQQDGAATAATSRTPAKPATGQEEQRDQPGDRAMAPTEHRIQAPSLTLTNRGRQALRGPRVEFSGERLSVDVQNRSARWLMEQISRETGVAILVSDSLVNAKLSRSFRDLPLEEGIRTAFGGYDLFAFYGNEDGFQGPGQLRAVWVYPRGEGHKVMPTPPETWASTGELEENLNAFEPALRALAAETLLERQGELVAEKVMPALNDRDESVRMRTLIALLDAGVALGPEVLADIARQDPSPALRATALIGLAAHPEENRELVRAAAEAALGDADAKVAQNARGILEQLTTAAAGEATAEEPAQPASPQ